MRDGVTAKIKLEIDWEQRGLALLLARIPPSVREVHLVIHTKTTPLVQDWNEYTPTDFLSVVIVGTSVLTNVDRLSIEVIQERWDINASVHALMNWCTSVVEVDVDVDTRDSDWRGCPDEVHDHIKTPQANRLGSFNHSDVIHPRHPAATPTPGGS